MAYNETLEESIRRKSLVRAKLGQRDISDLSEGRQEAMMAYANDKDSPNVAVSRAIPSRAAPSMASPSTAQPMLREATARDTSGAAMRGIGQPPAREGAALLDAPAPVQGGVTPEMIRAKMEQRRIREMIRAEQEGFSDLAPESRADAAGRLEELKARHTGLSAQMRPPDRVQTPDEIEMNRMRLNSQLQTQLEQQKRETDSRALQMAGQPVGNDPARIRELNMITDRQGQIDRSLESAQAGTTFGPTPTREQLESEGNARAMTRDSQITVGAEAERAIAQRIAERERVRQAMAAQAALVPEAQNAELRMVADSSGTDAKVRDLDSRTTLADAQTRYRQTVGANAIGEAGVGERATFAARFGEVARSALDSGDAALIEQLALMEIPQIEQIAAADPPTAATLARAAIAAMPTEAQLAEHIMGRGLVGMAMTGIGDQIMSMGNPTVAAGRIANRRVVAARVRDLRNRLSGIVARAAVPTTQVASGL
jgi:hypothetical protein